MLNRIQRVQRWGEVDARNTMTGERGDTSGLPPMTDEEMGVDLSETTTTNHYYPKRGLTAGQALLGAGLLAAGVATGAWLLANDNDTPPATTPQMVDTDTDQWNDITIGPLVDRNQ